MNKELYDILISTVFILIGIIFSLIFLIYANGNNIIEALELILLIGMIISFCLAIIWKFIINEIREQRKYRGR